MLELRGSPRLSTTLPVALRFPDTENPEGWGRILDLSPTGVKLETRWPLKVGEAVYLTFIPTHDLRLENLRAQVLRVDWEDGYYIGGMIFDASVDQNYLKDALVALMTRS